MSFAPAEKGQRGIRSRKNSTSPSLLLLLPPPPRPPPLFQQVLSKLIPLVVAKLSTPHPPVQHKCLEILKHVNARVRARENVGLPLLQVAALTRLGGGSPAGASAPSAAASPSSAPLVRSFALVYTEMAFARSDPRARWRALPLLARGIGAPGRPPQQRGKLLRLALLGSLERCGAGSFPREEGDEIGGGDAGFLSSAEDRAALAAAALDFMLYSPPSAPRKHAAAGAAAGGQQQQQLGARSPAALLEAAVAAATTAGGGEGGDGAAAAAAAALATASASASAAQQSQYRGRLLADGRVVPGGMSPDSVSWVEGAAGSEAFASSKSDLSTKKLGVVSFFASAAYCAATGDDDARASPEAVLVFLAAAADSSSSDDRVARAGDDALRKFLAPPTNANAAVPSSSSSAAAGKVVPNIESEALAKALLRLVLGGGNGGSLLGGSGGGGGDAEMAEAAASPSAAEVENLPSSAREPAAPALAVRALNIAARSRAAANAFPEAPMVVEATVFAADPSAAAPPTAGALRRPRPPAAVAAAGAEFCAWVLRHADAQRLRAVAPVVLGRLLALLEAGSGGEGGGGEGAAGAARVEGGGEVTAAVALPATRSFAYQAISQLASRAPEALSRSPGTARRLFEALAREPAGVRASAQEAVASAAAAFAVKRRGDRRGKGRKKGAADEGDAELLELLLDAASSSSQHEAVRSCAATWASRLFAGSHAASRWVCLVAAGDDKLSVREAGEAGLEPRRRHAGGAGEEVAFKESEIESESESESESEDEGGVEEIEIDGDDRRKRTKTSDGDDGDDGGDGERADDGEETARSFFPDAEEMLSVALERVPALAAAAAAVASGASLPTSGELPLPARTFGALVRFLGACRTHRRRGKGKGERRGAASASAAAAAAAAAAASDALFSVYELALGPACPGPLRAAALAAVLGECAARSGEGRDDAAGRAVAARYGGDPTASSPSPLSRLRLARIRGELAHPDATARANAAKLLGVAASAMMARGGGSEESSALLADLARVASARAASAPVAARPGSAGGTTAGAAAAAAAPARPPRHEEREGSALAAGFVLAAAAAASSSSSSPLPPLLLDPAVASSAVGDLVEMVKAYPGLSVNLEGKIVEKEGAAAAPLGSGGGAGGGSSNADAVSLAGAAAVALGAAGLAAPLPLSSSAERLAAVSSLAALLSAKDPTTACKAAVSLGQIAAGASKHASDGADGGAAADDTAMAAVDALLALGTRKPAAGEPLVLAAAEGLCFAFGGHGVGPLAVVAAPFSSLAVASAAAAQTEESESSPKSSKSTAPPLEKAPPPAKLAAVRERILDALAKEADSDATLTASTSSDARAAGCAWLVALLCLCGRAAALRGAARLAAAQQALLRLLSDTSSDLVQDAAPRGLTAAYALAGSDDDDGSGGEGAKRQAELLAGLTAAIGGGGAGGKSAGTGVAANVRGAIKVDASSRVLPEGAMGTTPDGEGLSTFRELSSLAAEAGDSSLIMKFMNIAHAASAASSARGAAFGLAAIGKTMLTPAQRRGLAAALLPKLFRLRHDPSVRVREAALAIWDALVVPDDDDDEGGEGNKAEASGGSKSRRRSKKKRPSSSVSAAARAVAASEAVAANFDRIASEVVKDASGRLWRSREAACLAGAELVATAATGSGSVSGGGGEGRRSWSSTVGPRAEEMLRAALRCADDVKPSVRLAGLKFAGAMRGSAIRACSKWRSEQGSLSGSGSGSGKNAAVAAAVASAAAASTHPEEVQEASRVLSILLPPLLNEHLPSSVPAVRAFALDAAAALAVDAAPRSALDVPLLSLVVTPALEALSGLEDARLNYLEQHVEAAGDSRVSSAVEEIRLAAARAGKLGALLDAAAEAAAAAAAAALEAKEPDGGDDSQQQQKPPLATLTPLLAAVIRRGIGAATRAGAARFVSTLAARAPREALASPDVAAPLLSALWSGAKAERGVGVRKAYVAAAAALVAVSPPKAAAGYVDGIVRAMDSGGGGDGGGDGGSNPRTRELAGMASLALLRSTGNGGAEAFASFASARVLPLAAVARRDPDEAAAAPWQALWDDAAPGGAAAARLYGDGVLRSVVAGLAAGQYSGKVAAAEAAADLAKSAAGDAALLARLAPPLADALAAQVPGRWFEGKDRLVAALGAVVAAAGPLSTGEGERGATGAAPPPLPAFVSSAASALAAAARRPKASFAGAALLALAAAAPALPRGCGAAGEGFAAAAEGLSLAAAPREVVAPATGAAAGAAAEEDPDARRPPPAAAAAAALEALAAGLTDGELERHGGAAAAAISSALSPAVAWGTRVAAAKAGAALARRGGGEGSAPPASFPAWMDSIVAGLESASAEGKVSAVRSAAADALGAVAALASASASASASSAASAASKRALEVLDAMASGDPSDAVKARAVAARSKATSMQLG